MEVGDNISRQLRRPPEGSIPREAVVVSSVWPVNDTGIGIAVVSALRQYARVFSKIHYFGPAEVSFDQRDAWNWLDIDWLTLPLARQPKWRDFLRSLPADAPAVAMRFRRAVRPFHRELDRILDQARSKESRLVIIYEDLQSSYLLRTVKRRHPHIRQAVHCMDPYVKGFEGMDHQGALLDRIAWRIELRKMNRFELNVYKQSDAFWTITQDDLIMYAQRFGIEADGVLGVCVDADRYRSVQLGAQNTVVHIGSADFRKGRGLHAFIRNVWPLVRREAREARLVIGGRYTKALTDPALGVEGLGFVEDDREVLSRGGIFVNPQKIGAGIKLKSVVAMLAGKALVSSSVGIEGVDGIDGKHFFVADSDQEMAERIVGLMNNRTLVESVGQEARIQAESHYNYACVSGRAQPLIESFALFDPLREENNGRPSPSQTPQKEDQS